MTIQFLNFLGFFETSPIVWTAVFFALAMAVSLSIVDSVSFSYKILCLSFFMMCACLSLLPFTNFVTKEEIGLYEDGGKIKVQGAGLHFSRPFTQVYYLDMFTHHSCEGGEHKNILGEVVGKIKICRAEKLDIEKFILRAKNLQYLRFQNLKGRENSRELHVNVPELFRVVTTTN